MSHAAGVGLGYAARYRGKEESATHKLCFADFTVLIQIKLFNHRLSVQGSTVRIAYGGKSLSM